MLFKPEHVPMILSGRKTETRRDWKRPMVRVGGVYKCKLKLFSKDCFTKIKVVALWLEELGEITQESIYAEGYDSLSEIKDVWERINGEWNPELLVWVVKFRLEGEK